jgi:hypothetical protein
LGKPNTQRQIGQVSKYPLCVCVADPTRKGGLKKNKKSRLTVFQEHECILNSSFPQWFN